MADIFDAHDVIMTPVMVLELSLTSLNLRVTVITGDLVDYDVGQDYVEDFLKENPS